MVGTHIARNAPDRFALKHYSQDGQFTKGKNNISANKMPVDLKKFFKTIETVGKGNIKNKHLRKLLKTALGFAAPMTTGTSHAAASDISSAQGAGYTVKVGNNEIIPKWDGWGMNLSWWTAESYKNYDASLRSGLADFLFSNNATVDVGNAKKLPGLGLNIVRYEIGAASDQPANGSQMQKSEYHNPGRHVPTFWLNWNSKDPSSDSWDWNADMRQQEMLKMAKDRGANHFTLHSVSPVWWMLKNLNPAGADDGGDNLTPWNYTQFVHYLVTTAKELGKKYDITFDAISPFNEPMAPWWKIDNPSNQSGCHFDVDTQIKVIRELKKALQANGMDTMIEASNEVDYISALNTIQELLRKDPSIWDAIGRIGVHGYGGGINADWQLPTAPEINARRKRLKNYAGWKGYNVWNTEYGDKDPTGMRMASVINADINKMGANGFVYWQPDWNFLNMDGNGVNAANPKVHVMAQYSRHIKEGMKILGGNDNNTVTAYDPKAKKLVLVTQNWGNAQDITWDLSDFRSADQNVKTKVRAWQTQTNGSELYHALPEDGVDMTSSKRHTMHVPANSIVTLEIDGVIPSSAMRI